MTTSRLMGAACASIFPAALTAQCLPGWSSVGQGLDGRAWVARVVDADGAGPMPEQLFAGGGFLEVGGVDVGSVARWDGMDWHALGQGVWATTGGTSQVRALGAFGGALIVGGGFQFAGGIPASRIAAWDGAAWSALGTGIAGDLVRAIEQFDEDGPGPLPPALFVAGHFTSAGGVPCLHIARWDGAAWSGVGGGLGGVVPSSDGPRALEVFDEDGAGPGLAGLYVAGRFTSAGGVSASHVARWSGAAWSGTSFSTSGSSGGGVPLIMDLAVHDLDGAGPASPSLIAVGNFVETSAGAEAIAAWSGSSWTSVASGLILLDAVEVFDRDGAGPDPEALYIAGDGALQNGVARVESGTFVRVSSAPSGLLGVQELVSFDSDGAGPMPDGLFAVGEFHAISGINALGAARYGCPPPCRANCNGDVGHNGQAYLNLADFGCFQTKFALGNMEADCDGDGVLTMSDFGCFQTLYAGGCP